MSWKDDHRTRLLAHEDKPEALESRITWVERAREPQRTPGLPPVVRPLPAVVLQIVLPGREYTHGGHDGLDGPQVQHDIYSHSPEELEAIKDWLLAALEVAEPVTAGNTRFHFATLEREQGWDPVDLPTGKREHRLSLDFEFYHEAA